MDHLTQLEREAVEAAIAKVSGSAELPQLDMRIANALRAPLHNFKSVDIAMATMHALGYLSARRAQSEREASIRRVGAMMSNICFNLAQHEGKPLDANDVRSMRECREAWDALLRADAQDGVR